MRGRSKEQVERIEKGGVWGAGTVVGVFIENNEISSSQLTVVAQGVYTVICSIHGILWNRYLSYGCMQVKTCMERG